MAGWCSEGRAAIEAFWTGDLARKPSSALTVTDAYIAGEVAHLEGTYNIMRSIPRRLIGAVALRAATYEEVEADRSATGQAILVAVLSSVAAGLGARGFGASGAGDIAFFSAVCWLGRSVTEP